MKLGAAGKPGWKAMNARKDKIIEDLIDERDRLRAALVAVEWEYDGGLGKSYCPACGNSQASKHKPDCTTGIALGRPECLERAS